MRDKREQITRLIFMRVFFALILSASLTAALFPAHRTFTARAREDAPDAELYQSLLDLTNPWTVMCVAAHPDDEDGATLTVLRRKMGVHTATLFSTYGEGGQNATGPELYEELGVIRARETRDAALIQGSEDYFLGLRDFGFSKSAEEAFRVWGHEEALRRMVLKIRELRPDVIITNHDTTSGHGHHQATGRLVLEAFDAAADPGRFPEQLRAGVKPWQTQRLFVRASSEGGAGSRTPEDKTSDEGRIVTVNPNETDPVRGTTYAAQALEALQRHASQGPWPRSLPANGAPLRRYRLARSAPEAAKLPADPKTFLDGIGLPAWLAGEITPLATQALIPLYQANRGNRQSILGALIALRRSSVFIKPSETRDQHRYRLLSRRLDRALALASGMVATIKPASAESLIPDRQTAFQASIHNSGETRARVLRSTFRVNGRDVNVREVDKQLEGYQLYSTTEQYTPARTSLTVPRSDHLYDGRLFGEELVEEFVVELDGATFPVTAEINLDVVPAVEIKSITPSPLVLTPQTVKQRQPFTFQITNHMTTPFVGPIRPSIALAYASGEPDVCVSASATVSHNAKFFTNLSTQQLAQSGARGIDEKATFSILRSLGDGKWETVTERGVSMFYADARVQPNLRVGYLLGSDNTLPDALAALGVSSKELSVQDVREASGLQPYDAIIIDNRGYELHADLVGVNNRLMDYVRAGGTLIVFYHKTNEWNPDPKAGRGQLAPYPILLGNARVTDEDAPVTFALPDHALLNSPNKLGPEDFRGWIQERGLYFPKEWDERYSAPLAMADPGEQALRGGLLAAGYGRGRYIYTSIVWYRQLRAGRPGAYRMLANMISYKSKG